MMIPVAGLRRCPTHLDQALHGASAGSLRYNVVFDIGRDSEENLQDG
jgi:hypothetical protein